jgi:hypothetical protein
MLKNIPNKDAMFNKICFEQARDLLPSDQLAKIRLTFMVVRDASAFVTESSG